MVLARHELRSLTLLKSLVTGINWKTILELLWPNTILMEALTERILSKTNSGRLTVESFENQEEPEMLKMEYDYTYEQIAKGAIVRSKAT